MRTVCGYSEESDCIDAEPVVGQNEDQRVFIPRDGGHTGAAARERHLPCPWTGSQRDVEYFALDMRTLSSHRYVLQPQVATMAQSPGLFAGSHLHLNDRRRARGRRLYALR